MHHHSALRITAKALAAEYRRPRVSLQMVDEDRPRTRGDCAGGERPCPWVSCRYHLAVEVQRGGSISINPLLLDDAINGDELDLTRLPETCALDVADRGPTTARYVAGLVGKTFQLVEIVVKQGLERAAKKAGKAGRAEALEMLTEWHDHPGRSGR